MTRRKKSRVEILLKILIQKMTGLKTSQPKKDTWKRKILFIELGL